MLVRTDQSDVHYQSCPTHTLPIVYSNGSTSLSYHVAQNPYISTVAINPANSSGQVVPTFGTTGCLTRVHGILMVAAWPMMAATSIFFAAWMRPALPASVGFLVSNILGDRHRCLPTSNHVVCVDASLICYGFSGHSYAGVCNHIHCQYASVHTWPHPIGWKGRWV